MEKLLSTTPSNILAIALSGLGIYVAVILFTRVFGNRSFSKMSSFDFAMTLAIGSIIATTILPSTVTLLEGVIGMFMVYFLQMIAAYFRKHTGFQKLINNDPLLMMHGNKIFYDNLKKARVTEGDLRSAIREANVMSRSHIKAIIFDTTGELVVLHSTNEFEKIEDWLMEDVALK